eukprot:6162688-Pyramimonas_sp.AAC.1
MVPRKCHACCALRHGPQRRRAREPTPAHPVWCRENVTPAMPCAMARIDAVLGDPPSAHLLWCRQNPTPAVPWTTVVRAELCCAEEKEEEGRVSEGRGGDAAGRFGVVLC